MPMYQPSLPCKSCVRRCCGVSWMRNFFSGGAVGVRLDSNDLFNWASADNIWFIQDLRRKFKVGVACGSRQH